MTTDSPLVSICVNNYNYERYVGAAVASALDQTYPRTEVVCVDDGSTDGSRAVIESFGDRVIAVFTENGGQGAAFNRGFERARGDIVLFLDADDRLLPEVVERVVAAFQREPTATKVQYRMEIIDGAGVSLGHRWPRDGAAMPSGDLRRHAVTFRAHHWQPTTGNAYARRYLDRVMPVDEAMYHQGVDTILNELAVLVGPIISLDEVLAEYRMHGSNESSSTSLEAPYFHRRIELIRDIHAAGRRLTAGAEIEVAPSPNDLVDVAFLGYRLASLELDPLQHPVEGDRVLPLMARGIEAAIRTPMLTLKQRVVRSTWFALVGLTPRPLSCRVIRAWTPDTYRQSHRPFGRLRGTRSSEGSPVPPRREAQPAG